MAKLKLFSGMDFAGKTTIVNEIDKAMPNVFKKQHNFLTDAFDDIRANNTKGIRPSEEVWQQMVREKLLQDTKFDNKNCDYILQDTLWGVKYVARKKTLNLQDDLIEIDALYEIIKRYPNMNSFYFTTSIDERLHRLKLRERSGIKLMESDKLLFNTELFERIEKEYQNLILSLYPNTEFFNTTHERPNETASKIISSLSFQKDL